MSCKHEEVWDGGQEKNVVTQGSCVTHNDMVISDTEIPERSLMC